VPYFKKPVRTEVQRDPDRQGDEGGRELPQPQATPETLKLSQVADLLNIPTRRIQYLRERGIVSPSVPAQGRGKPARYTPRDIEMLRLVADLPGVDEQLLRDILLQVDWSQDNYVHTLSTSAAIQVQLRDLKEPNP
jgi:hypothetical protein